MFVSKVVNVTRSPNHYLLLLFISNLKQINMKKSQITGKKWSVKNAKMLTDRFQK